MHELLEEFDQRLTLKELFNPFLILHYHYLFLTIQYNTLIYLETSRLRAVQVFQKSTCIPKEQRFP